MSLANKFNIPPALFETIKKMNEGKAEYQAKVKALMAKRGIKSLADLSPEEKKEFFNTLDSMHKAKNEEVELDEAKSSTGYDLYHKDFSSAMQHAYDFAKKKYNIEIDPTEIDRNVAMGPRKPGSGKANAYRLLDKTGKKAIQVQVANLDNKRYELNMYKEDVEQIDELSKKTLKNYAKKAEKSYFDHQDHRDINLAYAKTTKDKTFRKGFRKGAFKNQQVMNKRRAGFDAAHRRMPIRFKEEVEQIDEVKVGDKVSFSHSVAAAGGRSVKKTGTVHQIDGDTVHVKVKDKYGVMTHKKKASDLMKEDVELKEDAKSAAEKIETYAKALPSGDIDKKDFMKVASMLKRNKVKDAIKFTMSLDSDPRDYVIDVMQNNKINMKEEIELTEKGPGLWANIRAKRARGEKMRKPGEKGAPTEDQIRSAKNEEIDLTESHFEIGDDVICKDSGMEGEVVKIDEPQTGKYYTVKREDGKMVKYAPDELKAEDEDEDEEDDEEEMKEAKDQGASKKKESEFHKKLDTLVHKTFGKRPEEMKESDASYAAGKEKEKENKLAPSDRDKLAKIRAMMAKEKKPMKEDLDETFSPAQIDKMRQEYSKIKGIDPASDNYKKLTAMLDKLDLKTLQALAGAKIKFVSGLAQNRVVRKMNEDVEQIDELSEARMDKHELSGKVVIDGHVFNDAGKSGRSTYGRYTVKDPDYKPDPKEVGMHRNYRKPSSLSFSTLSDVKKWVKTQPKKSEADIEATHKKYAEREKMYTEESQIDEVSADVAKRVAQKRDQDFRKGTPTATQKRRMGRGDWRADPQLHADRAEKSAIKRGAKDVYDYNKKEEVEFDEASNPQISMKRAGLSVDRAKEVMRHQKEIGTIRKKREALRNSYDPSIIEAYKKMKNKKKEVTKDDNQIIKSDDKLSGKQEPIELEPELKEQKS